MKNNTVFRLLYYFCVLVHREGSHVQTIIHLSYDYGANAWRCHDIMQ